MAGPWEAYKKNQGTQQSPQAARNAQPGAWAAYKSSENYKDDVKNYKKTYKSATRTMKAQAERAAKLFQGRDARREEERQEQTDARNEKRAALREAQKQVTQMTAAGLPLAVQRQRTLGQMDANGLYARYRAAMAEVGEVDRDALPRDTKRAEGGRAVYEFGEALKSKSAGTLGKYAQKPEKTVQELEKEAVRTGGSDAAMAKWQNHWTEDLFQQYLTAMNATPEQMAKRGEMLAGMTWGKEEKQAAKALLENAKTQGLTGNAYNPSNYAPAWEAWLRGDEEEYAKQVEIYDQLYTRLHPKSRAITTAATEAFGLNSAAKLGAKLAGDETAVRTLQSNEKTGRWAQAQNPGLTVATKTIVNLGLMTATGSMLGAAAAPLAKGATVLGKAALEAGKSALTFAAKDAIQNAGNVATGEMSGSEFAKQIAGSAAGGVAGNIMSGLVSSGIAKVLTEKQMMTPFMEYLKNVAGSMAFSTGSLAANTAVSGRKMSGEEIATELTTSFAFALVNGYMQSMTSTKAASRAVEQKYDQIAQEFEAIQKHMSGKQFATQAEYEQALKDLRAHVQELKTEVSSTYYGGQQEFVNSMKDALDVVVNNLNWMLSGNTGAAPASGASGMQAADVKLLTEQAASALRSGANEPIGPQGGAAGSLAQAESTAVNDNPVQHTPAEQRVIEAYKQSADEQMRGFIERVRSLQSNDYKNKIRTDVHTETTRAVDKAGELTGMDTRGFKNIIKGNAVQHIDKRHGEAGEADHSMANIDDFSRIGFVLDNFTDAEIVLPESVDAETAKMSREWRSSDGSNAPLVRFSMPVNGVYYVVEAVPSSKAKSLAVVSAYISGKNKGSTLKQVLNLSEQTGSGTSETPLAILDAPENSVTQEAETVKREEWLPENMEVEDRNENGIPDNMEVVSGAEDAGTANAAETRTSTQTEQSTASGAQEASEPEVRTVLRKATDEDAKALLKGTDLFAGKQGSLLREYKGRLKQYDKRVQELAQTTDPERSRILQNQIEADEAYLTRREETLRQTADIARARMQNEARQQEADIAEPDPDELRTLERRTQREEQQAEQEVQTKALTADEDMLARFAERKGYSDLLTSYVIYGYEQYHEKTGKPVEQYAAGIGQAYTQGAQGMKLRATEQMSGIPQAILQQAYESGKEQNGSKGENDGGKRDAGVDPGQPDRRVEKGTGSAAEKQRGELSVQERVGLENRLRAAGRAAVSTKELGIQAGTDAKTAWEIPQNIAREYPALQRAEQTLTDAGAENVHFVTGTLRVTSENGQSVTVQAITQGTSVWIKASDVQYGLQETAEHEAMHLRLAEDPGMKGRLITAIRKQVTATELNQMAQRYKEAYEGCYGEDMDAYLEEILCDAYAGINRVGARADRYQSAVREAAGEARTQPAKKSPEATRGPPEQYSIEPSYAKKVKAWAEDGMPSDASFTLGTTGDVLQGLGAIESDIYMNGEKIRTILAEHPEMTLREIERIPEILDDPVLILKSRNVGRGNQQNSRLVIFGALKAQNGKPVLSVLDLRPNEGGFILTDMQKVTSAYTKDTNPKQYVQSSEVLFADKKRTIPLLRTLGFYMPSELQRSGSIGSISYKGQNVNLQGEKFSDVVRVDDAEQVQFRASAADIQFSPETQERAPELTDADAPVLSEEERQREAWRQMTREVDAEGERLRELERRGKQYMKQLREKTVRELANPMSAAGSELERKIKPEIDDLIDTYLRTGRLRTKKIEHAFERVYSEAKRMNREFAERYAPVQERIRQTAITLTAEQKTDLTNAVANEQEVRARALKDLYIVPSGGVEVGELYSQMRAAAPELFPLQKAEAWQQIMQLSTVSRRIAKAEILTAETKSSNPQYFKDAAWETFKAKVLELKPKMREAKEHVQAYERDQAAAREEMLRREEETAREDERRREEEEAAREEADGGKAYSYDALPTKARQYLNAAVNRQAGRMAATMDIPGQQKRELLKPALRQMMEEYLQTGKVEQSTIDKTFDDAYNAGLVEDREFYDTYKFIKDKMRTTGVAITPQIRADIADFGQFRKNAMGRLLMKDSGMPVDVFYAELHDEAPGLFPSSITNPTDQLNRMFEVSKTIEVTKKTLDESNGEQAEEFKRWARNDYEAGIGEFFAQLRTARRYAEAAERNAQVRYTPKTVEEATKLGEDLRKARKNWERVQRKILLTPKDEATLDKLLRGDLDPEDIQGQENAANILKAYEAKADYAALQAQMVRWRKAARAAVHQSVAPLLENTELAKDKKVGLLYNRETAERNIEDVFQAADAEKINRAIFEPVHTEEAKSTKYKNAMRERVKELKLGTKPADGNLVSEAHAVQLLGEAQDNIRALQNRPMTDQRDGKTLREWEAVVAELWKTSPKLDKAKIENAVQEFRKIYDELFYKMNEVRVRNGYEPVAYRKGYFPHFQPGQSDGILSLMGKALGMKAEVTALPTSINGITHTFKPGITWFGNTQERLGFNTAYDAVEGFDRYIEGAANVIFQTDNIQRLRAFNQQLRYRTTDDGIRERVDAIRADDRLTMEEKETKVQALYEHAKFELGNMASWLDEYTNLLAGKKHSKDREYEQALGRGFYNVMKWLESRVAANMVAVNPGSWLTNFIPITQAWGYVSTDSILKAMGQTIRAQKNDDGFWENSVFLTNRRGSDPLVRSWSEQLSATLGKPMEWIDTFTADVVVRARYLENMKRGMDAEDAMREADRFAANIMADRSRGATPTMFQSRNPWTKLFTQFQLEVNNQFSNIFKDLPREARERGGKILAMALFKMFFSAWLYNELYEKLVGRRAALDPIDLANDFVGDATGYKLNNIFDAALGDELIRKGKPAGLGDTVGNFLGNTAEELPMVGGLLGGGRVPFSSALPDLGQIWSYATNKEMAGSAKLEKIWGEVRDPLLYLALPFGGGQIRKVAQGIYAVAKGGKFVRNSKGELQMQYPVYTDDGGWTALRTVQALTFGRNATKEARVWVDENFSKLSAAETNAYLAMTAADVKQKDAWKLIKAMKDVEVPEGASKKQVTLEALNGYDISDEAKTLYYYNVLAGDPEKEKLDALMETGLDMGDYLEYWAKANQVTSDKNADGKAITGSKQQKMYDLLDSYDFTEEQKNAIASEEYKTTGFEPWTERGKKLREVVLQGSAARKYLNDLRVEGYSMEELREALKQVFRQEYKDADKAGRKKLFQKICNAYVVLGKTQKEAENIVNGWAD